MVSKGAYLQRYLREKYSEFDKYTPSSLLLTPEFISANTLRVNEAIMPRTFSLKERTNDWAEKSFGLVRGNRGLYTSAVPEGLACAATGRPQ